MDLLAAGQEALQDGDFAAAYGAFQQALTLEETPQALEGLCVAAGWCDDGPTAITSGERAYRLYTEAGDEIAAARAATSLADHYFLFRNQLQVALAWVQRGRGLLSEKALAPEHGYLAAEAGFLAYMGEHDAIAAGRFGAEAAACGRALDITDLKMFGLAIEGLAKVSMGNVEEGMAQLDEASIAATTGEVQDPAFANMICCYLIYACEWVHDFVRAQEWCEHLREFCRGLGDDPTFLAICRTHYAGVLMWKGEWSEAESHLTYATETMATVYPGLVGEAYVRLGELRRRQGRLEEAIACFDRSEHEPRTLLGRAAMALDRNDTIEAIAWAERLLRRLAPEALVERMTALDLVVRAHAAAGNHPATTGPLELMWEIARAVSTSAARARVLAAEGVCAAAAGRHSSAVPFLEDASDLFHEAGGAFEAAQVRADLARSLQALGRTEAARREFDRAIETFRALGAERHVTRTLALQRGAGTQGQGTSNPGGLSPRELEVLRLVARGHSNSEIADELVLSVRTVERHVATIYEKLNFEGRNARAAAVSYALREGIVTA